jgi:hypothetical protein
MLSIDRTAPTQALQDPAAFVTAGRGLDGECRAASNNSVRRRVQCAPMSKRLAKLLWTAAGNLTPEV